MASIRCTGLSVRRRRRIGLSVRSELTGAGGVGRTLIFLPNFMVEEEECFGGTSVRGFTKEAEKPRWKSSR